jgi:tetracycline repressor-like protein
VEARLCAAALLKLRQGRTKEIANGLLAASAENPHLLDPVREVIKATLENLKATSDDLDAAREHKEVCWGGRPPLRHRCAKMRSLPISNPGDRPWTRLFASEWIRQNTSFSCTG